MFSSIYAKVKKMLELSIFLLMLAKGVLLDNKAKDFLSNQNDYTIDFERFEVVNYTKQHVRQFTAHTFKYNRTCTAFNITFIANVDIGNEMEIVVQAYKFMSNEYRYFPLRFEINYCAAMSQNVYGMAVFGKCGNFEGCKFKKGINYHICNWVPDQMKFPPFIPTGRYMTEFQGYRSMTEIWFARAYMGIGRPIV